MVLQLFYDDDLLYFKIANRETVTRGQSSMTHILNFYRSLLQEYTNKENPDGISSFNFLKVKHTDLID